MSKTMNEWLAGIYGTDGAEDIEKTAEAILLQKLAQDGNLDLSQFSPEELQQLLAEVLGEDEAQAAMGAVPGAALQQAQDIVSPQAQGAQAPAPQAQPQAPQQFSAFAPAAQPQQAQSQQPQVPAGVMQQAQQAPSQESLMKEAQAKFEEADLLGRVMAHAYTQELEKIAAAKTAGAKDALKGAVSAAKGKAQFAGGVAKAHVAPGSSSKARGAIEHVKRNRGAYGAAAGFAAGRASKTKEASAFEKLAEMQAAEILGAAGFDPATGTDLYAQQEQQPEQATEQVQPFLAQQPEQQVEQQEVSQEDFQNALDSRALEMLAGAGYNVDEIVARIQAAQQQEPGNA